MSSPANRQAGPPLFSWYSEAPPPFRLHLPPFPVLLLLWSCLDRDGRALLVTIIISMFTIVPLGALGFIFSKHGPTTRPCLERTAEKACMLRIFHSTIACTPTPPKNGVQWGFRAAKSII